MSSLNLKKKPFEIMNLPCTNRENFGFLRKRRVEAIPALFTLSVFSSGWSGGHKVDDTNYVGTVQSTSYITMLG